ncbi:hypothetical protein HDV05_007766 [Chytridiales sp. JEL 0842]|nr:hypothetical protein HDV05_007766 [Chytridiales sp. JEL 0842]
MFLIGRGHKVAVLAVDPSSSKTGGSILGDKTRMIDLSRHTSAFVRPSPSSCTLGGVARNTTEAILLCEAAGYDIVLVETVGVGQSETMVADMVDMFVLLVAPGGGDELQGLKKGIVEMADMILVNKADGVLAGPAKVAQMEYLSALKFVQSNTPYWKPEVMRVSSSQKVGISEAWERMKACYRSLLTENELQKRRGQQRRKWMWKIVSEEIMTQVRTSPAVQNIIPSLEEGVKQGAMTSGYAAERILDSFRKGL